MRLQPMTLISKLFILSSLIIVQGCSTISSTHRPMDYNSPSAATEEGFLSDAFLGSDDQKIRDMLNYEITLPRQSRVAILKLNKGSYWNFYSDDFNALNKTIADQVINKLKSSDRIYDAAFLPAMLISEKRSVQALREASARFQADLLLAYRNSCQSFQKYRMLDSDETKSYCSVEAVLLDIRSGIIIKSIVSTEIFTAQENDTDTNFRETIKKAELEAIARALGNISHEVVKHLESIPEI